MLTQINLDDGIQNINVIPLQ